MKGLTDKQRNLLNFIEEFMETAGMAPTIYEIAEHFQIKTSTVFAHIRALQKKNLLTRSSKARSLTLTRPRRKSQVPANAQSVPLLTRGGEPTEKEVVCDSKVFKRAEQDRNLFAMHVESEDLAPLGILPGDIVILRGDADEFSEGDIVLAEFDGEESFRVCHPLDAERVELFLPDGSRNGEIFDPDHDDAVKGVVIGIQRSL